MWRSAARSLGNAVVFALFYRELSLAFIIPRGFSSQLGHRDGERAVLDAIRECKAPFSPDDVVIEFAALLTSYGIRRIAGGLAVGFRAAISGFPARI
jgi:hypothetical protein